MAIWASVARILIRFRWPPILNLSVLFLIMPAFLAIADSPITDNAFNDQDCVEIRRMNVEQSDQRAIYNSDKKLSAESYSLCVGDEVLLPPSGSKLTPVIGNVQSIEEPDSSATVK